MQRLASDLAAGAQSSAANQSAVDSLGNPIVPGAQQPVLSATSGRRRWCTATPRYGGLQPQSRDAMPSKRGMFENPSQIADAAQQALGADTGSYQQRRPVQSLNPDISQARS